MTKLPIGLQLYSIREELEKDFEGTLKKVKEMGYDAVEFAGLYGRSAQEVKQICSQLGLVPISAHVGIPVFKQDITQVVACYREIGCRYLVIPWTNAEVDLPGGTDFEQFKADLITISEETNKQGMKLCYHNHDFEFEKIDGKNKLDILYDIFTPEQLQTQLDTCWVGVGGEDPVEYIEKYKGRAPLVHIKDYIGKKSKGMYELIDGGETEKTDGEQSDFDLRPVGYGVQNVTELIRASERAGAEAIIVEQDYPSMQKTSMECAKMSIDYIRNL